jgi:hypothetical protein
MRRAAWCTPRSAAPSHSSPSRSLRGEWVRASAARSLPAGLTRLPCRRISVLRSWSSTNTTTTGCHRFALRHGLAGLVASELDAGEASEIRFMSSILDHMTLEERRAYLFALDEYGRRLAGRCAVRLARSAERVECELRRHARALAPEWPAARVRDRARLRLALHEVNR